MVNFDKPLDKFLKYEENLLLQMREGGEVAASSYFIRNSKFGYCFYDLWRAMAPPFNSRREADWIPTPNHDNGDLVVLHRK